MTGGGGCDAGVSTGVCKPPSYQAHPFPHLGELGALGCERGCEPVQVHDPHHGFGVGSHKALNHHATHGGSLCTQWNVMGKYVHGVWNVTGKYVHGVRGVG
jgi:hypothetical protein